MYLRINPNSGVPLGVQIAHGLRLAIAMRRLEPGGQLPSARSLAAELKVNFHTVRKAYGELEVEGVLEFRRGVGTFVAAARPMRAAELRRVVQSHVGALARELAGLDVDAKEVATLVARELARSLRSRSQ